MDYDRMGIIEGPLGSATPTHWWKSPRWIVIRIEALVMVAIIMSFFLAALGSCRRWSNRWIVQKGFFIAQVLSLSLGTYSVGLMQSSSVKSEMYPIWTASLFALFGCIDPVTTYNGVDYKGPLSKVVYGIFLNCGYVLIISLSTVSSVVGNAAIVTLSAITFIKGFHRSFALVQQNKILEDMVNHYHKSVGEACVIKKDEPLSGADKRYELFLDLDTHVRQGDIEKSVRNNQDKRLQSCYDVCVALCLSHKLQRHILGLDYRVPVLETLTGIDFKWALKVIEIELALVYDAFFTGNPFFHYYQAKTASFWALASLTGICFVLAATAIPGEMTRRSGASGGCTKVVGTTTVDLAITFGILVSLSLLQLMQLVWSWTSNWAKAAVACSFASEEYKQNEWSKQGLWRPLELSRWMRLKVFVATSTNLFDKYLWQDKIGQHLMLPEPRLMGGRAIDIVGWLNLALEEAEITRLPMLRRHAPLVRTLGLHYIGQVIGELLSTNKTGGVKLDEDVKGSVIDFLSQIQSDRLDRNWLSFLPEEQEIRHFLPHFSGPRLLKPEEACYRYTSCVMMWHIVTSYCELEEKIKMRQEEAPRAGRAAAAVARSIRAEAGGEGTKPRDDRRVANALSQYCAYLVKSAPELLPGPVACTKQVYDLYVLESKKGETGYQDKSDRIGVTCTDWHAMDIKDFCTWKSRIWNALALAKLLLKSRPDEIWKTLALVWVQLLVYAAPYGNVEAHMRRLPQGGEFITHLWALLYHLDIREWKSQGNMVEITTSEDAQRILTEDDQAVVAFLYYHYGTNLDEVVATASRLEDGVKYYYTSNLSVFKHLAGSQRGTLGDLVFLKKEANNHKVTFYEGVFRAYDIARFVTENKIALAHDRAQAQRPEDDGAQREGEIEEEIQPHPIP